MELMIKKMTPPEAIEFNFDELKAELAEKVGVYKTIQYTPDTIAEAKKDRAALNKFKKTLGDERLRLEREYMGPFKAFKDQVDELIRLVDEPCKAIDAQIKEWEQGQKKEKRDRIQAFFDESNPYPEWLHLQQFGKQEWLNASYSITKVKDEIEKKFFEISNTLETLSLLPEYGFEAAEIFKRTLDPAAAMAEAKKMSEMAKRKQEAERLKAQEEERKRIEAVQEPGFRQKRMDEAHEELKRMNRMMGIAEPDGPQEHEQEQREWLGFRAFLSAEDAAALAQFFKGRNIKFEQINIEAYSRRK